MGHPSYRRPEWYGKREDAEAMYIVSQCGVGNLYRSIGKLIHRDDLGDVRRILGLRPKIFNELFPPKEPGW